MVVLQPIKPGSPRWSGLGLKRGRARRALSLLGNSNTKRNLEFAESLMTISAEDFAKKWNFDPVRAVPLPRGRFQWAAVTPNTPAPAAHPVTIPVTTASPAETHREDLRTCLTLPTSDPPRPQQGSAVAARDPACGEDDRCAPTTHRCLPRTCACPDAARDAEGSRADAAGESDSEDEARNEATNEGRQRTSEGDSGVECDDSPSATPPSPDPEGQPRLRQTCITEFVRPKKRLTFTPKDQQLTFTPKDQQLPQTSQTKKRSASSLQEHLQPPHKKVLLQLRA